MLVVFEQLQVKGAQASVGGVDQATEHLAVAQRGVDQAGVHLADVTAGQLQVVGFGEADQSVGAVGELGVQGDHMSALFLLTQYLVQLADGVYLRILLGNLARQGQGVGVAEFRWRQPDQAFPGIQFLDLGISRRGAGHALVDVVIGHQRHPGVFPDHVQLAGFMGAAGQIAAQSAGDTHIEAVLVEVTGGDFRQHGLFGEDPCAEADHRFCRGLGKSREQQGRAQ
ncbi:hypothetical protein D3C76_1088530 [compost metagenome]